MEAPGSHDHVNLQSSPPVARFLPVSLSPRGSPPALQSLSNFVWGAPLHQYPAHTDETSAPSPHHTPRNMIRDFQTWNNTIGEASQLEDLRGLRVGIEAAHYLDHRLLNRPRISEPLVPALGGLPLGFWQHIDEDLKHFAQLQIEPFFVFSGLDIAKQDDPFRSRQEGAAVNATAWHLYDSHEAEKSVQKFGESRTSTADTLSRTITDYSQPM